MAKRLRKPQLNQHPRCPRLHVLPHHGPQGQCTALWCADPGGSAKVPLAKAVEKRRAQTVEERRVRETMTDLVRASLPDEAIVSKDDPELRRLAHAERRRNARIAKLGALPALEGKAVEQYAKDRFLALTPEAIQVLEAQLKFGDEKEQKDAARDVLDYAGFKRGEGRTGGTGPVVILFGDNVRQPPWATQPTIDVKATKEIANGTNGNASVGPHHQPGEREDAGGSEEVRSDGGAGHPGSS